MSCTSAEHVFADDIDFKELATILSVLSKGSFEEKVRLCFEMYDTDRCRTMRL